MAVECFGATCMIISEEKSSLSFERSGTVFIGEVSHSSYVKFFLLGYLGDAFAALDTS